jgi:hypothetical protein
MYDLMLFNEMFCGDNFCEVKIISKPKAETINSSKMLVTYETT